MKKYAFKGLGLVLAVALIVGCFAGCAKINYVTDGAIQAINEVKDGSWKTKGQEDAGTSEADYDKPVIEDSRPVLTAALSLRMWPLLPIITSRLTTTPRP